MIYSMTGFGRSTAETSKRKLIVEIKSLNSKQLDLFVKIPSYLREHEIPLRNIASNGLSRGKVEMVICSETVDVPTGATLNIQALEAYKQQISTAAEQLNVPQPNDWFYTLLRLPDSMTTVHNTADDDEIEALQIAVKNAIDALNEFRKTEGAKLQQFFTEKISSIGNLLAKVEPFENERVAKIRTKLQEQLAKLDGIEIDNCRLEQELIFYIEKLDVTEEKTRLRAHLNYFLETMEGEAGQGKKLGFIAQEIGREINTLGSKSNNADMQRIVVMMKDELEQIKEQVLNVL